MSSVPRMTDVADPPAAKTRWTAQWKELYDEVVDTGLCTGCAGCVVVCPHDVLGYDDSRITAAVSCAPLPSDGM